MAALKAEIVQPHSEVRQLWDAFVERSPQGCIFCKTWWLDVVWCGHYRLLLVDNNGRIEGGMPLLESRKWAVCAIRMPPLTQTSGILLSPRADEKPCTKLSHDMRVIQTIVDAIPPVHYFAVNFHPQFTNWLPFYWAGYAQTTRYTYRIDTSADPSALWANVAKKTRKTIRKAEQKGITIAPLDDVDCFIELHKQTFRRQRLRLPYSEHLVRDLIMTCRSHDACQLHVAHDPHGRPHCATCVVYDTRTMYALMSGSDPTLRSSGAHALAKWQSIMLAHHMNRIFDFEGSMMPNVECFNRGFGAYQIPYFHIYKKSPWIVAAEWLRPRRSH